MFSRLRRITSRWGLPGLCSAVVLLSLGCNGASPFLAAAFNTTLTGTQGTPDDVRPPGDQDDVNPDELNSLDDLPPGERSLQVAIENASDQFVKFRITFLVSAGPGGFVPEDDMIQDYLNAGYSDAVLPGSGGDVIVGCDTVSLVSGSRVLAMQFGTELGLDILIGPNETDDPNATNLPTVTLLTRGGSAFIPLPELIVLGSEDPDFICTGSDLCTQRGFVYVSAFEFPVGKAPAASRIQGSICAENFGTAPEWRLDKTLDEQVQPFQFAAGGVILLTVLDRDDDSLNNQRNQVVWLVTDAMDRTIHFPDQ